MTAARHDAQQWPKKAPDQQDLDLRRPAVVRRPVSGTTDSDQERQAEVPLSDAATATAACFLFCAIHGGAATSWPPVWWTPRRELVLVLPLRRRWRFAFQNPTCSGRAGHGVRADTGRDDLPAGDELCLNVARRLVEPRWRDRRPVVGATAGR